VAVPDRNWQSDSAQSLTIPPALWRGSFWVAVSAGMALALWPAPEHVVHWFAHADKLQHAVSFGVLVLLGTRGGYRSWPMLALGLVALGAAIEVLQGFTPTRTAEFGDWLADAAGVAVGFFVDHAFRRLSRRQP
jgi:VanZ family protein